MTALDDRIRARAAALIGRAAKDIVHRRTTTLTGPNPAPNPPTTGALKVSGAVLAGAGTITLAAASVSGRLVAGDAFTVAGDATVYTVTATVVAANNRFTAVPFAPVLAQSAADGAAATLAFAADRTVKARISGFPARLVDGTLIKATDLSVLVAALDLPAGVLPGVDKLIIDGDVRAVVTAVPNYAASQPVSWTIQAR